MSLPDERQRFIADTRDYSGPLREAGRDVDQFGDKNSRAALAARRMGMAAKEAADKAAKAMSEAGEAAEKLAMGEIKADEAAQAEARALKEMERAALKAAEAERALARAVNDAAQQERQAAKDAALAGAAQKLAALKAAGAVREHNAEVLRLRKEMPELEKASEGAFTLMTSASGKFGRGLDSATSSFEELSGIGRAAPAAILIGLQLLGPAAAVAGGAITLGLGGALTAVAIKAAASNKQIRSEYSSLGKEITGDLKDAAEPMVGVLQDVATESADAWRHTWQPEIKRDFAELAPAVDSFVADAIGSLDELAPTLHGITRAFTAELRSLGPELPSIMHNIGTGIDAVTSAVAKNPQALTAFVNDLSMVVRIGGDVLGFLTKYSSEMTEAAKLANAFALGPIANTVLGMTHLHGVLSNTNGELQVGEGSFQSFSSQAISTGIAAGHLATTMQMAGQSAKQMAADFDAASGKTVGEREALIQYRQAVVAMTQSLKENGAAHGFATAKGAANEQALDGMAVAAQKAAAAMKDDGKSAKDVSAFLEGARQRIIAAAEKMHYSASAARDLADKLLGVTHAANSIPSGKKITVTDNTSSVRARIAALQRSITNLHGKTVTIDYIERVHRTLQAERARADGGLVFADGGLADAAHLAGGGMPRRYYPSGGQVSGPGTSTSDSIPAMLSNGEFVVNAKQTAKWLPVLEEINQGVNGFKSGGKPTAKQKAASAATLSRAKARPEYLAALAAQHALEAMRSSVYGGMFRGGASTIGSAHGSVVQHVTNVTHVHVAGSVWELTKLTQAVQQSLIVNRAPVTMPGQRF